MLSQRRGGKPGKNIVSRFRLQSAMEYLMTYGWAILIIAVVLGALFQLGVFNAGTFAPRAPPGACQVFRPNGPGSTNFINLEGVCSGELPQYVASFAGGSTSSNITASTTGLPMGSAQRTVTFWFDMADPISSEEGWLFHYPSSTSCTNLGFGMFLNGGSFSVTGYCSDTAITSSLNSGTWYFAVAKYDGTYMTGCIYISVSPVCVSPAESLNTQSTGSLLINDQYATGYFSGKIANFQIYNTSLSTNEIQALYVEGIGGAPLVLQNLVGWWPLNGNANDYSGDNNNGVPSGVTYTSQWTSGYTTP